MQRPRTRVRLELDGMVAVHAVRAVWTALGAVPGVVTAEVTMAGAMLEVEGVVDRAAFDAVLRDALAHAGVGLRAVHVESSRILPLA